MFLFAASHEDGKVQKKARVGSDFGAARRVAQTANRYKVSCGVVHHLISNKGAKVPRPNQNGGNPIRLSICFQFAERKGRRIGCVALVDAPGPPAAAGPSRKHVAKKQVQRPIERSCGLPPSRRYTASPQPPGTSTIHCTASQSSSHRAAVAPAPAPQPPSRGAQLRGPVFSDATSGNSDGFADRRRYARPRSGVIMSLSCVVRVAAAAGVCPSLTPR